MTLITGTYTNGDGTPATGTVTFTLYPAALDTGGDQRTQNPVTVPLDAQGELSVDLVPDTDLIVDGESLWRVQEDVGGLGRSWWLLIEDGEAIDLPSRFPGTVESPGAVLPVPGPPGTAATVDVGSTTTGAPGTDADVTNTGDEHAAVFDFTIPRGDQGEPGTSDHSVLDNLDADDHPQYALVDGTRAFTGNLNMGFNVITSLADGEFPGDAVNVSQLGAHAGDAAAHHARYTDLEASAAAPVQEAPDDGGQYVRQSKGWEPNSGGGIPDAPVDGLLYGRRDAAWAEVESAGFERSPLLDEAQWHIDAGQTTPDGAGLADLSGGGNDLMFTPGAEPVVLPHAGTDYLHIPATADNGVSIPAAVGTAWTATRSDGTTLTGTTTADPWVFDTDGDWARIESDNGTIILDPSLANDSQTAITNPGSAGGEWTINRADTGLKTVVVDRPKLLFGGEEAAQTISPLTNFTDGPGTAMATFNNFGTGDYTKLLTTGYGSNVHGTAGMFLTVHLDAPRVYSQQPQTATQQGVTDSALGLHTLAGREDGTNLMGFLDGVVVGSSPSSGLNKVSTEGVTIGREANMSLPILTMRLRAEVYAAAIFPRALTDTEIAQVSAELQAGHPIYQPVEQDGSITVAGVGRFGAGLITFGDIVHEAGDGSPEGIVTGAPGSVYTDRLADTGLGGDGLVFWRKWTGTGSTGWIAETQP